MGASLVESRWTADKTRRSASIAHEADFVVVKTVLEDLLED
jgi:hypothetical protein